MKNIMLFSIVLISVFSCKNEKISPEIIDNINGNIAYYRICYQSTLDVENNEIIEKNKRNIRTEYFDGNNNIIKEMYSGYGASYNVYEYDDNGNNNSQKRYNEDGEPEYRNEYCFDEKNRIISNIGYDKDGNYDGEAKFIYDYFGNMIQKIIFDKDHEYNNSAVYAYDINGRCYSTVITTPYDLFPSITIYKYTMDGRVYDIQTFGNGHRQSMTKILEYDDDDRETKSITYVYDFDGKEVPSTMNYYEYHTGE